MTGLRGAPARVVIAATHSGAGKTTATLALIAALRERGLRVQPFKVGPDFIDPTHLAQAAGRRSINLDGFFLDPARLRGLFLHYAREADIAVVEGVMGLFDGKDPAGRVGSTAAVARLLAAPVVLVVDASAMAGSIAAVARGFRDHDPQIVLAGLVANRVGSEHHAELLRAALEPLGVPLLGTLRNEPGAALPERHLGLVLAGEQRAPLAVLARLGQQLDLERIVAVARSAGVLAGADPFPPARRDRLVPIAVAQDEAFSFYYPESFELLSRLGAELLPFSPLRDADLPRGARALLLGGGYPELWARELSENLPMREAVASFRGPVVAECGGYLYLCRELVSEGEVWPMAGLVPAAAEMSPRPTLGYREVVALRPNPLAAEGDRLLGHEFHYARLRAAPQPAAWGMPEGHREGFTDGRLLASFVHLYLLSTPWAAERLLATAARRSLEATTPLTRESAAPASP